MYQEWSTTQRTSSQLDTTVGSVGVNVVQHPIGTLSKACSAHALTNSGCSERTKVVQVNIRKVFLFVHSVSLLAGCYGTEVQYGTGTRFLVLSQMTPYSLYSELLLTSPGVQNGWPLCHMCTFYYLMEPFFIDAGSPIETKRAAPSS